MDISSLVFYDADKLLGNFYEVKLIAEVCGRTDNSSKCNLSPRDGRLLNILLTCSIFFSFHISP